MLATDSGEPSQWMASSHSRFNAARNEKRLLNPFLMPELEALDVLRALGAIRAAYGACLPVTGSTASCQIPVLWDWPLL